MIRPALLVLAALLGTSAHAEVYKCQEGGRTVITDKPCHANAAPIDVKPASGAYDPKAGAAAQRRLEVQLEAERVRQVYQDKADARRARANASAEPPDKCEQMVKDHARAKRLSKDFIHPHNVARQKEIAKELESRNFHECPPHKRISIFSD